MQQLIATLLRPGRPWVVLLLGVVAAGAVLVGLGEATLRPTPTDSLAEGADSTRVVELQAQLPRGDDSAAVVLFTDDDGLDRATLVKLRATFADAVGPGAPDLVPSEDGTAALGVASIREAGASGVADAVTQLRADLRTDLPDGVTVQVTGPAAIQADLAAVFDGADLRLLLATAGVVAFLLLLTYRSPILWVVAAGRRRRGRPGGGGPGHPDPRPRRPARGTSRRWASCPSWCSAPARTTRCC